MTYPIKAVGSGDDGLTHLALLVPSLARQLAEPDEQKESDAQHREKITVRIQAIAEDGLRFVEISTAASSTSSTWQASNSQLIKVAWDMG
jgi:hypothetical protein